MRRANLGTPKLGMVTSQSLPRRLRQAGQRPSSAACNALSAYETGNVCSSTKGLTAAVSTVPVGGIAGILLRLQCDGSCLPLPGWYDWVCPTTSPVRLSGKRWNELPNWLRLTEFELQLFRTPAGFSANPRYMAGNKWQMTLRCRLKSVLAGSLNQSRAWEERDGGTKKRNVPPLRFVAPSLRPLPRSRVSLSEPLSISSSPWVDIYFSLQLEPIARGTMPAPQSEHAPHFTKRSSKMHFSREVEVHQYNFVRSRWLTEADRDAISWVIITRRLIWPIYTTQSRRLVEMQDLLYFESRAGTAASVEQASRPGHLVQLKTHRKAAKSTVASMTHNVATRLDAQNRKADIPEEIFREVRARKMAANEFLRQVWSGICPPVGETTLGGPTTLVRKTAKATRMAGYLTKTPEKVAAVVRAAEIAGVDRTRVQTIECTPL
ncbi:hypothetical protein EDB85DRAFT_1891422 [Lactarius pseudohatsudake]|nr:hypothetical protein EDB85DRAFT_1891422 [Lactarius pseudohatsudake]